MRQTQPPMRFQHYSSPTKWRILCLSAGKRNRLTEGASPEQIEAPRRGKAEPRGSNLGKRGNRNETRYAYGSIKRTNPLNLERKCVMKSTSTAETPILGYRTAKSEGRMIVAGFFALVILTISLVVIFV